MLQGYANDKRFATITTTKKDVDYQCWYPGRKDNYSWIDESEGEGELVYNKPAKANIHQ